MGTRNPNTNWEDDWETVRQSKSKSQDSMISKRQFDAETHRVKIEKQPPNEDWEIDWQSVWEKEHKSRAAYSKNAQPLSSANSTASAVKEFKPKAENRKKKKKHGKIKGLFITVIVLTALYCVAVFSNIPFIAKWRGIYIETAMGTMTHQWLATAFIPRSVIDSVMNSRGNLDKEQESLFSNWEISNLPGAGLSLPWESAQDQFFRIYKEIDKNSFNDYTAKHADSILNSDHYLMIDEAGLKDDGTTIKTVQGDQVLAIDTVNGITIVKVTGDGYVGRLAVVKDPSRVGIGLAKGFGSIGSAMGELVNDNNAVLGINASGFYDPEGKGNGGEAYGLVLSNGKTYTKMVGRNDKVIAFDFKNKLNIGKFKSTKTFRDGVEFKPALVINGEKTVKGSSGWGVQPRSAIGQTSDGEVLMLVVDGRQPGYSIGCTVGDLADIMVRYGAMQACNLDGGSSSIMYYNGREISKPSAANKKIGRRVPNGFMVYKK